jgi:ATP-binding cassette subfamily F protein 3
VDSPFHFQFPESKATASALLNISHASMGYEDQAILSRVNLSILPGTRLGLLGPNGAGKSTLIKSLVGDLALISGDRVEGEHLAIGYFAQHQLEALDSSASPALHLQRITPTATDQEVRNFLGGFGFSGDAALGSIQHFSGGEKARLALAIVAWQKPNLLLLDEPTNHLDLEMRHALTVALQGFNGAVIVVSHDRHLLKNTVDQYLLVAKGEVTPFEGDLADYEKWLQLHLKEEAKQDDGQATDQQAASVSVKVDRKEQKRLEAELRKRTAPLRNQIQKLEQQIERCQAELGKIEAELSDAGIYEDNAKQRLNSVLSQQKEQQQILEEAELEWLDLSEQLEAIQNAG